MRYLAVCLGMLLLCGCGGGGGGGPAAVPLSDTIRAMQPGDQWVYDVTGSAVIGGQTFAVTGTYTETARDQVSMLGDGSPVYELTQSMALIVNGEIKTSLRKQYFAQEESGAIHIYGDKANGVERWTEVTDVGGYIAYPSPMSVGATWGGEVFFTDGSSLTMSREVTGTQAVSVGTGAYQSYVVEESGSVMSLEGTAKTWYCPQLANAVQMQATMTDPINSASLTVTAKLKSYSFAH